ncbi:MAG: hypothetical protein IV100_17610 [Myxococcales bacterium]|nr:hypothetical protein [Myxococcales bacterium]
MRRALGGTAVALALTSAIVGCRRVPEEAVEPVPLVTSGVPGSPAEVDAVPEKPERSMDVLCSDACGNWARLRFLEPIGYDQLNSEAKSKADDLLADQRRVNREACTAKCMKVQDRRRAECLSELANIESGDVCFGAAPVPVAAPVSAPAAPVAPPSAPAVQAEPIPEED